MFIKIDIYSESEIAIEEQGRIALCKAFNCTEKDLPYYVWQNRNEIIKKGGINV